MRQRYYNPERGCTYQPRVETRVVFRPRFYPGKTSPEHYFSAARLEISLSLPPRAADWNLRALAPAIINQLLLIKHRTSHGQRFILVQKLLLMKTGLTVSFHWKSSLPLLRLP